MNTYLLKTLSSIILFALLFDSCAKTQKPIEGRVVEFLTNKPIQGAVVSLYQGVDQGLFSVTQTVATDTTDKDGHYLLDFTNFKNFNSIDIGVSKNGYLVEGSSLTSSDKPVNFTLRPYGIITIHIKCTNPTLSKHDYISLDSYWGGNDTKYFGPDIDTSITYTSVLANQNQSVGYSVSKNQHIQDFHTPSFFLSAHETKMIEILYK